MEPESAPPAPSPISARGDSASQHQADRPDSGGHVGTARARCSRSGICKVAGLRPRLPPPARPLQPITSPRPPPPAPSSAAAHGKLEAAGCSRAGRRQGARRACKGCANRLLAVASLIYEAVWEPRQVCKSWTPASRAPGPTAPPPPPSRVGPHGDPSKGPGAGPEPTLQIRTLRPGMLTADPSLGHWLLSWWLCPKACRLSQRPLPLAQRSTGGQEGERPGRGTERETATPSGHPDTPRPTRTSVMAFGPSPSEFQRHPALVSSRPWPRRIRSRCPDVPLRPAQATSPPDRGAPPTQPHWGPRHPWALRFPHPCA